METPKADDLVKYVMEKWNLNLDYRVQEMMALCFVMGHGCVFVNVLRTLDKNPI